MLRIGLTGSIGVGKSFVASVFSELGCHVLDADDTAREVVAPGSAGLKDVVAEFGNEILRDDGTLDRAKLGTLVFEDAEKRGVLNSILHPYIIAQQDRRLRELEIKDPNGIGLVDAALMIESGGYKRFDKLIVVYCRPEVQIERVMVRNNLTRDEAERRINAQLSQEAKKKFDDYLIDTSDGFEAARKQTKDVYGELTNERRRSG